MRFRAAEWSAEEIALLHRLAAKGLRPSLIAERLGRPVGGVKAKAAACRLVLVGERSREGISLRSFGAVERSAAG